MRRHYKRSRARMTLFVVGPQERSDKGLPTFLICTHGADGVEGACNGPAEVGIRRIQVVERASQHVEPGRDVLKEGFAPGKSREAAEGAEGLA